MRSADRRLAALLTGAVVAACLAAVLLDARMVASAGPRWWKGNLHTHSLWSDGDDFPEMIVQWYKDHDYDFLAISDHNVLAEGERWIDPADRLKANPRALREYRYRFGDDWVQERTVNGKEEIRLRPLAEYRSLFEQPGRFLLIQSEEITDSFERKPVHINATNIRSLIRPQGGTSVREVMQNNVNAVWDQRRRTKQPMFPHLNHPNFRWAITAEELADVRGERFFEVYNGHPECNNLGDDTRPGTEKMWDTILTRRLERPRPEPMWGMAVDDAHRYHSFDVRGSIPGRGWVVVRATELSPAALVAAMEAGDFYASTGVTLADVVRKPDSLHVEVQPEPGCEMLIQFFGTRKAAQRKPEQVGELLHEQRGHSVTYRLRGDELYVRARVTSSRRSVLPPVPGQRDQAWTQPVSGVWW